MAKTIVKKPEPKVLPKKPEDRSIRVESGEVFLLQKNIPVTASLRSIGPHLRYPFAEMMPGESFEVKVNKNDIRRSVSRTSSACTSYVRRSNKAAKFTVRRTSDTSIRVWRIK